MGKLRSIPIGYLDTIPHKAPTCCGGNECNFSLETGVKMVGCEEQTRYLPKSPNEVIDIMSYVKNVLDDDYISYGQNFVPMCEALLVEWLFDKGFLK